MKLPILITTIVISGYAFSADDPSIECFIKNSSNERFAPISKKMSLLIAKDQTFEMLANTSRPSKEEKVLISEWAIETERCYKLGKSHREVTLSISLIPIMDSYHAKVISLAADLYAARISYGEFAKIRASDFSDFEAKMAAETEKIRAYAFAVAREKRQAEEEKNLQVRRQVEHQQMMDQREDQMRRQAALQMLMNRPQTPAYQMQPYQMQVPVQTNCYQYGNQTNCTTR